MAKQTKPTGDKPNILFIMADDIGWYNVGLTTSE
jgi:arylsulfatase A-like enzyme